LCRDHHRLASKKPINDHPMVITEIQEMEPALQEFKAAVQRGETVGDVSRGMIKE
jgi:hypothetical protein